MKDINTLHFVYATPLSRLDQFMIKFLKRKLRHQDWNDYNWPNPVSAPLSITYQISKYFSKEYNIKLYDLREQIVIAPKEGDILLGHLWPNPESIVWNALNNDKFKKKYLIFPLNHDPKQVLWTYDGVKNCDKLFAICGKFWIDTLDKSPIVDFKEKIVQLNMCINADDYPFVKSKFNSEGNRKFLYIGRNGYEKGTDLLEQLAAKIDNFQGGYISLNGEIKGWKKISDPIKLTPDFVGKLAEEYDVFINMSRADAQATTILEAMSWGFPVACTRESGYSDEDFFYLDLEDEKNNIEQIKIIQTLPDKELKALSIKNRRVAEAKYHWDRLLTELGKHIGMGEGI